MRVSYDRDHDVLHLTFGAKARDADEVGPGIFVMYDDQNRPTGATILDFSRQTAAAIRHHLPHPEVDPQQLRAVVGDLVRQGALLANVRGPLGG